MKVIKVIILTIIASLIFKTDTDNLKDFYSSVLPFVFVLIIGIKSLLLKIDKKDYDDLKAQKKNLNDLVENLFKRLIYFFASSFLIFIVMNFSIDKSILKVIDIALFGDFYVYIYFIFDCIVIFSLCFFIYILVDIHTYIKEYIKINKSQ